MINTEPLTLVLKSLSQRVVGARELMNRLPLLDTGTGSQRNQVLADLKQLLIEQQFGQNADLHRLAQFIQYLHQPKYEDTLGREGRHDLSHLLTGLAYQSQELKRVSMVHAAGTQPKGWVEAQLRVVISGLSQVLHFGREMDKRLDEKTSSER